MIASDLIFSEWEDGRTPTADIKFPDKKWKQVTDRWISSEQSNLILIGNQEDFQKKP